MIAVVNIFLIKYENHFTHYSHNRHRLLFGRIRLYSVSTSKLTLHFDAGKVGVLSSNISNNVICIDIYTAVKSLMLCNKNFFHSLLQAIVVTHGIQGWKANYLVKSAF